MPESSRAKLPFPLPDQAVTTFNIDSEAVHARLLYPFLPDYVGQRNPYNGEIIQSSDDYERYLREHCYYNRCAREFHSIRVRLEDALDENLRLSSAASKSEKLSECNRRLTADNENLKKTENLLLKQRKELQATVEKQNLNLRVFVFLFILICIVCVILSFFVFSLSSSALSSESPKISASSTVSTSSVTPTKAAAPAPYIGNSQTKIIHDNSCPHLPYSKYRVEYRTLTSAFLDGYSRCPTCLGGDGESTRFTSAPSSVKQTEPEEHRYIGNKSSKKVHDPDCSFLPDKRNRVYFDDLDEALDDGYEPCKKCHPS